MLKIWYFLWCMFFHGSAYSANPKLDGNGKKGVHCAKCNVDFAVTAKVFAHRQAVSYLSLFSRLRTNRMPVSPALLSSLVGLGFPAASRFSLSVSRSRE